MILTGPPLRTIDNTYEKTLQFGWPTNGCALLNEQLRVSSNGYFFFDPPAARPTKKAASPAMTAPVGNTDWLAVPLFFMLSMASKITTTNFSIGQSRENVKPIQRAKLRQCPLRLGICRALGF